MLFLLFVFFLGELFERGESPIPQLREVIAEQRQALGIQLINSTSSFAAVPHQARILQDAQVLRYRGARNRQAGGKLVHGLRMVAQHLEDGQPGGVAQRRQSALYVSFHLR